MNNKNFLISLIAALIGLIAFLGGYLIAQKGNSSQQANISNLSRFSSSPANPDNIKNPENKNLPRLTRLSVVKAANPVISGDGKKILYFEKETGKVFTTDFSGQKHEAVRGEILTGLTEVKWSPNGSEVIISQSGSKKSYLNLETKETRQLNDQISGVSWSKNSQKIAYLFYDPKTEEGQISVANPDGSVFKNILPTRASQLTIDWINDGQISFYNPAEENSSLFLLDIESKQLEKTLNSLIGLKILWSPDGSKLLYSYQENAGSKVALLDRQTKLNFEIDLPTKADQCVWSLDSFYLYCGASLAGSKQAGDNLYQLDAVKKEFGLFFESLPTDQLKIKKPLLSPAENFLFFINDFDQYLYRVSL